MSRVIWNFKQLLPLTYWTKYGNENSKYFCIWTMWFGKCFNVTTIKL